MEQTTEIKQFSFKLNEVIHSLAKKRVIDLKINLAQYMTALIQYELENELFDGVDIQGLLDKAS